MQTIPALLLALTLGAPPASGQAQEPESHPAHRPDAQRHLLGGAPLSSVPSSLSKVDHPAPPSSTWGPGAGPLPTNRWWSNVVLPPGDLPIHPLPYSVRVQEGSLSVCKPSQVVQQEFVLQPHLDNLVLGAEEPLGSAHLTDHDDLSVTVRWEGPGKSHVTAPLVRGMPFVSLQYEGLTPHLSTIHAILSVDGAEGLGLTAATTTHTIVMNNGQRWRVHSSVPIRLEWRTLGEVVATAPLDGFLRVVLADPSQDALFERSAQRVPLGGRLAAISEDGVARIELRWRTTGTGPLLMGTLPHHREALVDPSLTKITYPTLRGPLQLAEGEVWTLEEPLTSITWSPPRPIEPSYEATVRAALLEDASGVTVTASDPYFAGKQLARIARLALIADELDEASTAAQLRAVLSAALTPWLEGSNTSPLVYDRTWGGIVSAQGLDDPGAAFGNGYYNDHHFHYGYHIYAAAVLAKEDVAWRDRHREQVLHLVRDIANPSPEDPHYSTLRHFDGYVGHSWASGLFAFGDAKNQESTSEAVHAWYAVSLWGLVTENERLRDLGRTLLAMEIRSARRYWQIPSTNEVYPAPFRDNKVVGVLWSMKVDHQTFFGGAPEFIHGIQMLPVTPISEELLDPLWCQEGYPLFSVNLETAGGWADFMHMSRATFDRAGAWQAALDQRVHDGGNSRTNLLHWIATRP